MVVRACRKDCRTGTVGGRVWLNHAVQADPERAFLNRVRKFDSCRGHVRALCSRRHVAALTTRPTAARLGHTKKNLERDVENATSRPRLSAAP